MRRASFILIAVAGALLAQSAIDPPLAGFIRCEDGKLRPVYGLAGNFVLGAPLAQQRQRMPTRQAETTLSLPGGARLLADGNDLVYRKADGTEVRAALGGPVIRIERMSDAWIHVRAAAKSFAARLAGGRLEVYRLPEAAEMRKWLLAAMLVPCLAPAQMTLYVASQATERAVGDYYNVGTVAVDGFVETAFRVRNTSTSPGWLSVSIGSSGKIKPFSFRIQPPYLQLDPEASIDFSVRFAPTTTGSYSAYLNVNGVRTILTGTGREPEFPRPEIVVIPVDLRGGSQARVSVRLASEAKDPGAGELSIEFIPSATGATDDPAVLFLASGRRTVSFSVQAGRDIALFSGSEYTEFQTGTTAGSIRFTAKLGPYVEQLTVTVPSAAVVLDTAHLLRSSSGVEVQLAGFDTSRTACRLGFTFYDRQGRPIPPGEMQVDASKPFQDYFTASKLGGMFTLRAVFVVRGDASQIGGVDVYLVNSFGTTRTARLAAE